MRAAALVVLLLCTASLTAQDQPKAIAEALKVLEKGLADAKDEKEKAQIREAIAALKGVGAPAAKAQKPQNEIIGDFIDNMPKYKGKTLTFKMTVASSGNLRELVGPGFSPLFRAEDPKNGAELLIGIEIPAGLDAPAAKKGDVVIVTFKSAGTSDSRKGNTVISITRP